MRTSRMARCSRPVATSARGAHAVAQTAARPGWANDYLAGELEARYIDGEAVLDAYRQPLVYVCQVTEGVRASGAVIFNVGVPRISSAQYGLSRIGRRTLATVDAQTREPLAADPDALPDPANRMHSDRRIYAAPSYEDEFELWSVGGDRRLGWMRDDARNRDNVPLIDYDKPLR
jgi:hypothetical protein